ncbi:hypothetical protein LPJ66_007805 [Kickxella alabastrina]|uniref:Uncharacterized protein n=1 Tax=Kickxella alabastrina TaxID=61397 RepID=A0ACC1IBJ7_9FUNG|nr:hypothetical protein LPJ66_007805 [Kickxella alabastrina]
MALKYPAIVSQSDIALVISVSALFNQGLRMKYMNAAKRVLKYLKTTCNMAIHYRWSEHLNLVGYCDDSFGLHIVEAIILSYVCTLARASTHLEFEEVRPGSATTIYGRD